MPAAHDPSREAGTPSREAGTHAYAREPAFSPRLYASVRRLANVLLRLWFRVKVSGDEHIPRQGPVIVAPNHKNFLDPFFIGIATRRHVRFMAKVEIFDGPLGWLFLRLGAFPVRRGGADAQAMETARAILSGGGLVVVFPEGTRIEAPDVLGSPHHGAGRLALETGAPIVPAAITGTSPLWRGALPKLKRVQIAFLPTVIPQASSAQGEIEEVIDERVWPAVQEEYGRLRASPGMIAAGLGALGLGGGLLATRRRERRRQVTVLGVVNARTLRRRKRRGRLLSRFRPLR